MQNTQEVSLNMQLAESNYMQYIINMISYWLRTAREEQARFQDRILPLRVISGAPGFCSNLINGIQMLLIVNKQQASVKQYSFVGHRGGWIKNWTYVCKELSYNYLPVVVRTTPYTIAWQAANTPIPIKQTPNYYDFSITGWGVSSEQTH